MAILCPDYNLLFIMNPRTGCTASAELLINDYGGEYIPKEDILNDNDKVKIQSKHTTVNELIQTGLIEKSDMDNLLKFTSVRNPFDSLVSLWTKKKYKYADKLNDSNSIVNRLQDWDEDMLYIQEHTFSEWIIEFFSNRNFPTINAKHVSGVNRWLKFENLQDDFNDLIKSANIQKDSHIPMLNKTKDRTRNYRSYYTPVARKVVEEKFKIELMIFNYEF
jgi:hypothetical protein